MSETLLIHSLIHPPPPSNFPHFSLLIKLTSWVFFLGAFFSYGIVIPSPPPLYMNPFSDPRSENSDRSGPPPLASQNSVWAVARVAWEALAAETHRSRSCAWSLGNAGDTWMHCTIHCLCAMQITCGAGTSWNVELTQSHCCAIEMGQLAACFPLLPIGWLASFF